MQLISGGNSDFFFLGGGVHLSSHSSCSLHVSETRLQLLDFSEGKMDKNWSLTSVKPVTGKGSFAFKHKVLWADYIGLFSKNHAIMQNLILTERNRKPVGP